MPDLLLEIGTEELPPAEIAPALRQLADGARALCADHRLDAGDIQTFGTPRRLVLYIREVAARQRPAVREIRGPAAHVAFDAQGAPTQAAIGFARSQAVAVDRLQIRESGGRRYAVAVVEERGAPSARVLPDALAALVTGLAFKKTMRWGDGDARFARPVRWVVALFGSRVLPLTVAGAQAGRTTHAHRVLGGPPRRIPTPGAYVRTLRAGGVIIDPAERERSIRSQVGALARAAGGTPILDPALLDEIVMSTEHPQALAGAFDRGFLALPRPVLVTVMQHHQKYFAVEDARGRLLASFIAVRDGDRRHLATVRQGHAWVLQARLADARFFFNDDRKRPLEAHVPRLEDVIFHAELGTMAEKTRRVVGLARHLTGALLLDGHTTEALLRAATLCKADLVTHMVGEFPELQGTMGQIYAELDGEPAEVARAIGEHYRPTGAADSAPKSRVGALLGLVDKCDTLVGALGAGLVPTGSQDPYGLRRAAQGIVEILLMLRLRLPLAELLQTAAQQYGAARPGLVDEVMEFIRQRLRAVLIDRGIRYDLVDAVLAAGGDDLVSAADRAETLQRISTRPEFARLYVAYDRASRILGPDAARSVDRALFEHPAERVLDDAVRAAAPEVQRHAAAGEWPQVVQALVRLAGPVDHIFDDVLIMAPDPAVRANRLALLGTVTALFRQVADFSKVVMAEQPGTGNGERGTGTTKKTKKR